jgi:hypothetical protein
MKLHKNSLILALFLVIKFLNLIYSVIKLLNTPKNILNN